MGSSIRRTWKKMLLPVRGDGAGGGGGGKGVG